jgi:argininosuccinate lyase
MAIAKTDAAGGSTLLPEVLSFSSSLSLDQALLREDVIGSLAHVTMLGRTGVIPKKAAIQIRGGLIDIWKRFELRTLQLPDEEDIHMAIEAELGRTIGPSAGLLHSARSRNDQVATDLRLHVRESAARALESLCDLTLEILKRAQTSSEFILPAYTHRQRAQPISLAYWLAAYASAFSRDAEAFVGVLQQCRFLPLGVGAISGTSLHIDRQVTRALLQFEDVTINGLDTVGDRDFACDYLFATTKFLLHASRLSTDLIDFTTSEFGFASLADDISMGSSMMPQKKNPDVFELIRGKSGKAIGNLTGLLATIKGLPGGYNRDLQEDRAAILETKPLLHQSLSVLRLALPRVTFHPDRCLAAVAQGFTQATDLAEALVKTGMPFREAYQVVGRVVRRCQELGIAMTALSVEVAQDIDERLDAESLSVLEPRGAVARKKSEGSTGPESVAQQLSKLRETVDALRARSQKVATLPHLFESLQNEVL